MWKYVVLKTRMRPTILVLMYLLHILYFLICKTGIRTFTLKTCENYR